MECVHCHAIKKVKSKTIQWIKSRNCDIIEDKLKRQFSKFKVCVLSQSWDICGNVLCKIIEPSMEPLGWMTYLDSRKIV